MKVVQAKSRKESIVLDAIILQKTMIRLRGKQLVPKGVYRFKTFQEADQWMMHNMVSTLARRNLKTS